MDYRTWQKKVRKTEVINRQQINNTKIRGGRCHTAAAFTIQGPRKCGAGMKTGCVAKKTGKRKSNKQWPHYLLSLAFVVLLAAFCCSAFKLTDGLLQAKEERDAFEDLSAIVAGNIPSHAETSPGTPEAPYAQAASDNKTPLPQYLPLYEMNPDFFGWISIDYTDIDYPVMYSPGRPEYYLDHAFDGTYSSSGVPFLDGKCTADGNYYLIYGHHMQNKTMFGQLPMYAEQSYWEEHPVIRFDTLYEQREYQVVAAFYSRVYGKTETGVFRYYEYTDLSDKEIFNEYMEQVYAAAIYDTGIEVAYGDELLALSTCNYHTDNGRFVVVARRVGNAG